MRKIAVVAVCLLAACRGPPRGARRGLAVRLPKETVAARAAREREAGAPRTSRSCSGSARAHDLLRRRVHPEPSHAAGEGAHPRRTRVTSPASAPTSTSGASTTMRRPSRRSMAGNEGVDPSVQRVAAIRAIPTSSRSSAGNGRRSARRRRITTGTRTSSSGDGRGPRAAKADQRARPAADRRLRPATPLAAAPLPALDFRNASATSIRPLSAGARRRPLCPAGVDTRELPEDCAETAHTPRELFEKLAQWGFDSIVIPHGNTVGSLHAARVDVGQAARRPAARSRRQT
jgi:hypothetical protein